MAFVIPQAVHDNLIKEFRIAADKMKEVPDLPSKLYFFSATFGAAQRALNVAWSNELALLHQVLQTTHNMISSRLNQVQPPIQLPEEVPGRLTEVADRLATVITADTIDEAVLFGILAELAALGYSTTGNGYYLYLKGELTL